MPKIAFLPAAAFGASVFFSQAMAQTPIPPSPKDFVLAASESDHYEILAANVAVTQSQDARVRAFAQDMIRDHALLSEALSKAAASSGLSAPTSGMSSDQAMLLSALQGVRGADFDKTYAGQQVLAHTQAVAVEDSFAATGTDQTLQKAAQAALPTIKEHLQRAQQLKAELGGM